MKRLITTLSFCLLLAGSTFADVVTMKDGRKFEGTVIEQTAEKIIIKTKFGVNELKASDVESVDIRSTPEEEFKTRREQAKGDAEALFELYMWAQTNGLKSHAKIALRDVIKADADHEEARRLLGYVRFEDRWVTEKEHARLVAEKEREEMEAKGLVLYDGKWLTPAEKEEAENLAKGMIKVDGVWVNAREKQRKEAEEKARKEAEEHRAKGEYLMNGKWVPKKQAEEFYSNLEHPYRTEGDNVVLYTNNGIDFGDRMLVAAEAAFRKARDFFGGKAKPEGGKLHVFVVADLQDYNNLGNSFGGDEKSSNFVAFASPWIAENPQGFDMVSVTMYSQADSLTEVYVTHATVEQYVRRVIGRVAADPAPRWFIDGVSSYIARWQLKDYFSWSRDKLISVGGLLKLKTYFGGYQPNEQYVISGGLVIAFLQSDECPADLKEAFDEAIAAVLSGEKVQKTFRKLEKDLSKKEDALREFGNV